MWLALMLLKLATMYRLTVGSFNVLSTNNHRALSARPADNPYVGGNSNECSVSGGQSCQQAIACTLSGGGGNNAVLNVQVYAK